jgi:integrase
MLQFTKAKTAKSEVLNKGLTNLDRRSREYLLPGEVEQLVAAGKLTRYGHRDSTLILLSYRHGLRVNEAVSLTWSDIDFDGGSIHINRLKRGVSGRHPLRKPELIALHRLRKEQSVESPYLFNSQQGTSISARNVGMMISKTGIIAELKISVHPHMLRHACGYYLANKGFDTRAIAEYLGHKSLDHTYRYTAIAPGRFNDFWGD